GGDQPDDPDVDADGEDVGEPAPPPVERQVAHGAVGPGEADDREGKGVDRDDDGGGQQAFADGDQGVAVGGGAAGGYRRSSLNAGHRVRGHGGHSPRSHGQGRSAPYAEVPSRRRTQDCGNEKSPRRKPTRVP